MDNFNSRDGEVDIFAMMRQPEGPRMEVDQRDGPGMEVDQRDEAQTSAECYDGLEIGGHLRSDEVY